MIATLEKVLKRIESWPVEAQTELAELVSDIDLGLQGPWQPAPEELAEIDEAEASGVATPEEVEAAFRSYRT